MRQRGEVLEPVEAGGTYILKPQTQTFPNLPENEHVCMTAAAVAGIDVPAHTVVRLRDDSIAYVVKRFDRTASGKRIHCEDFAQILGREKYAGSIEAIGRSLRSISSFPGLDAQYLFERAVVNFFLGNGDAHLKNFSILYDETGGARLAPAYDIVSSKLVIPEEPEAALAIRGKHNRISRQDFMALAEYLGITEKPRDEIFRRIEASRAEIESLIDSCLLPPEQRARLVGIVRQRASRLFEG